MYTPQEQAQRQTQLSCVFFGALLVLFYDPFLCLQSSSLLADLLLGSLSCIPAWAGYILLIKTTNSLLSGWRQILADVLMGLAVISDILGIVWMFINSYPPRPFTWFGLMGQLAALFVLAAWMRQSGGFDRQEDGSTGRPVFVVFILLDLLLLLHNVTWFIIVAFQWKSLYWLPSLPVNLIGIIRLVLAAVILWRVYQLHLRQAIEIQCNHCP